MVMVMIVLVIVIVVIVIMVMPAAASLAMGMRMGMGMRFGMRMRVFVAVIMVMMMIIMPVMMRLRSLCIGPALGVEGGLDGSHLPTKALHHRLDHMVAADAQALPRDLHREMPVAEMPGEAQEMLRAFGADFRQRLARPHHFHHAAVFQLQGIARAQGHRLGQVEQDIQSAHGFQREAAAMAIIEIEHHRIGRFPAPISPGDDS
jgi:hypothetical protein